MAVDRDTEKARLSDATTWDILQQWYWWRRGDGDFTPTRDMSVSHLLHALGWMDGNAQTILHQQGVVLTRKSTRPSSELFEPDHLELAHYFFDLGAEPTVAETAVRSTPMFQHLLHRVVDALGTGVKGR